jgi:hypothetical protein
VNAIYLCKIVKKKKIERNELRSREAHQESITASEPIIGLRPMLAPASGVYYISFPPTHDSKVRSPVGGGVAKSDPFRASSGSKEI